MSKPTPAWLLERLAQGELDASAAEEVRARLRAEGRSPEAVLAALAEADRAFLATRPPQAAAAAIRARLAQAAAPRPRAWRWALPLGGLAVAALLVVARPRPEGGAPTGDGIEQTRDKGSGRTEPKLVIYRQRDTHNERLASGARADRGDRLQLAYVTRAPLFGAIVSLDGRGHVTAHLPEEGATTAAALQAAGEVQLPASYELDDAPGFERFFLVTARTPFAVADVVQAVQALAHSPAARSAALVLPAGFSQTSVRLDKRRQEPQ